MLSVKQFSTKIALFFAFVIGFLYLSTTVSEKTVAMAENKTFEARFKKLVSEGRLNSRQSVDNYFFLGDLYKTIGATHFYIYEFDKKLEREAKLCRTQEVEPCFNIHSWKSYLFLNELRGVMEHEKEFLAYFFKKLLMSVSNTSLMKDKSRHAELFKNINALINNYSIKSKDKYSQNVILSKTALELKKLIIEQLQDMPRDSLLPWQLNLYNEGLQNFHTSEELFQANYIHNKKKYIKQTYKSHNLFLFQDILSEAGKDIDRQSREFIQFTGKNFKKGEWALTYDDGPHHKNTEPIMNLVNNNELHATFFWLAENVKTKKGMELLEKAKAYGFSIANHSYSHANLSKSSSDLQREIFEAKRVLKDKLIDWDVKYFRLPYGSGLYNKKVQKAITKAGMYHFFWNVDSLDWEDPDPQSVYNRVIMQMKAQNGGIILLHDWPAVTPIVTKLLIRYFNSESDQVRPLSDILEEMGYSKANPSR